MTALLRAPFSLEPQTDRATDVAAPEADGEGSLAVSAAQSAAARRPQSRSASAVVSKSLKQPEKEVAKKRQSDT